ncbi:hypothetical protein [Streptomyces mirabilis]|uniref:hypothetical protein n=1 Tax=Streptomyces mirabilis TaxID=68239 RepID=UPI0033BB6B9F
MTSGTAQDPAGRPVLGRWLTGAGHSHPVRAMEASAATNAAVSAALDVLESMLAPLDAAAVNDAPWRKKRGEFAQLSSMGQFLEMRAEFALSLALSDAGIGYLLGDTKVANPDLLLIDSDTVTAGIEVTARAPQNIAEVVERVEEEMAAAGGAFDVHLAFSSYPSRLQAPVADALAAAVRAQADPLTAGQAPGPAVIEVDDPKNAGQLEATIRVTPGGGTVGWEVTAGELANPLDAASYAVFEAGRGTQKAAQGASLGGAPVILAVDVSRYGAAWMRPGRVWAGQLAASPHFTPGYPFAALAVFCQSLDQPGLLNVGIGLSPHLSAHTRQQLHDLCHTLGWPSA